MPPKPASKDAGAPRFIGARQTLRAELMKRFILALNLVVAANVSALHGLVRTVDGQSFEGDISLAGGVIGIAGTNGTNRVELKNLALLRLPPPAQSVSAPAPANASLARGTNGLLGLYFNTLDLTGAPSARIDPTIDFDWGQGAPVAGVNPGRFSARWEGRIIATASENYTFHSVTGDGVRLWVNNNLMLDAWRDGFSHLASIPMVLTAGEQYDLRMEIYSASGRARAKLFWSSPSMPRAIVPTTQLAPAPLPANVSLSPAEAKIPAGVTMVGGSIIARRVHSADSTRVRFSDSFAEPALSTVNVARILLQPLAKEFAGRLPLGRPGLLLKNQDFVEGEFRGLARGTITLSSVLFGIKTYDVSQALALVLRDLKPAPGRFELKTRDESLLLVNALRIEEECITVQDSALAGFRIPAAELFELKRGN